MGRIDSKTWKMIEIIIMQYPKNKRELSELLEDIVFTNGSDSGKTNFDTEYSKPQSVTEAKAFKLQTGYYKKLSAKVEAVEAAYNTLNKLEQQLIAERYWKNPKKKTKFKYIDIPYSERQMNNIVKKMFMMTGIKIGEIKAPE